MDLNFSFIFPSPVDSEETFSNVKIGSSSAFNLARFYFAYKKYLNSRGHISKDELRFLNSLECFYIACRLKGLI